MQDSQRSPPGTKSETIIIVQYLNHATTSYLVALVPLQFTQYWKYAIIYAGHRVTTIQPCSIQQQTPKNAHKPNQITLDTVREISLAPITDR